MSRTLSVAVDIDGTREGFMLVLPDTARNLPRARVGDRRTTYLAGARRAAVATAASIARRATNRTMLPGGKGYLTDRPDVCDDARARRHGAAEDGRADTMGETETRQRTCAERLPEQLAGRIADLRALLDGSNVSTLEDVSDLEDEQLRTITNVGWVSNGQGGHVPAPVYRWETCETCGGEVRESEAGAWVDSDGATICTPTDDERRDSHEPDGDVCRVEIGGDDLTPDDLAETARETLNEYGLSLEKRVTYVWQLSTGGPGDQFEITVDPEDGSTVEVGYRFLDWFDGAYETLRGSDEDTASEAAEALGIGELL